MGKSSISELDKSEEISQSDKGFENFTAAITKLRLKTSKNKIKTIQQRIQPKAVLTPIPERVSERHLLVEKRTKSLAKVVNAT